MSVPEEGLGVHNNLKRVLPRLSCEGTVLDFRETVDKTQMADGDGVVERQKKMEGGKRRTGRREVRTVASSLTTDGPGFVN